MLTAYILGIEDELASFKNKTLIDKDYRNAISSWAAKAFDNASSAFDGPTLEMDKVVSMNGQSTTVSGSDDNFSVGAMPCPKSGEIRIRLAHESTIDLPIPGVEVKLYEDKNWAKDEEVKKDTTNEKGEVVFSGLEPGKLYYPIVTDNNLVENNKAMIRAYDEHMLALYQSMSTRWTEYKPQWQQSRLGAAILESFGKGLEDGLKSLWTDAKTAYNVITNPGEYATKIYEGASALYAQVGQLESADIEAILTSSKQMARELFALFNDEAMLYLLARSVILNLRMYPWGELLIKIAGIGGSVIGETLIGVVFGALMSLIAGPLGIAYLAYRLGRAFKKALHLVQEVWAVLTKIMKSSIELLKKAFEKTRNINHRRQINAPLSKNKQVELGSSHSTELADVTKETGTPGTTPDGKPNDKTNDTCINGCPVSMVTGEELLGLNDARLPGVYPFTFTRQYRTSAVECSSYFGFGWSHSLQHQVAFTTDGIRWTDHENLTTELPLPDKDIPTAHNRMAKAAAWLSQTDGEYLLTSSSLNGWIMHVQREGDCGTVTGFSQGKQHLLLHYRDGLPVRLENPAGVSLLLRYQDTDNGPRLHELHLAYDPTAEIRPPELAQDETLLLMQYTYDERGQLSAAVNATGETERYEYRPDYVFEKRTLAGGAEFYWQWEGEGKQVRAVRHWSNLPNLDRRYAWDTAKGEVTVIYEDGSQEVWQHDKETARLTRSVTPDGAVTEKRYGKRGELLEETAPGGEVIRYSYNHDLLVTRITAPDGQVTRQHWSFGRLLERIRVSADMLEKQRETWKYDSDGNIITHTSAAGDQWHYEWDETGNLVAIRHPDGSRETWTVNALGQVTEYTNRAGETTWYRYNAQGLLTEKNHSAPDTPGAECSATRLHWNMAGRLAAVEWPDGTRRQWRYNPYGQVTEETDENGLATRYQYHANSALVQRVQYPDNTSLEYHYNNIHGLVSDIINHKGERYHLEYTPSGRLREERTFDGRRLSYLHDLNGRIVKRTEYGDSGLEETALTTGYEYDVAGRLTTRIRPDGQKVRYEYDGFGRLHVADDGHWPLAWGYDDCNRLTQEHQGFASQYYAYNADGQLSHMRMVDGNILKMDYENGELFQIIHNGLVLSEHQWQRGRETRRLFGSQHQNHSKCGLYNDYDSCQQLISQRARQRDGEGDILRRDYQYDPAGNLQQILDSRKGTRTFTRDLKNRLATARHEPHAHLRDGLPEDPRWNALHEEFSFDGDDNLLGMNMPPEGGEHQAKVKGDRLLLQGDHHYEYDEFGNLIADRWGKAQCREHRFEWNCEHRLVRFTDVRHYDDEGFPRHTLTHSWRYEYDVFGRRICKTDEETGKSTLFFWQDDRMVTECDEAHADFTPSLMFNRHTKATDFDCISYLYEPGGSFRPLAQLKGRGVGSTVNYYVNDHIGTPQELLDEDGNVVWSAIYRAYGHVEMQAGVRQPLRFQGQYADEESGLHYNRYRYYNPLAGRYISQDPISIRGGLNTYSYVFDPLAWIDPLGLDGCPVTKYEVSTYDDLKNRSTTGDDLDIHHVPQKHPAGQVIDGYDPNTAPSIALPKTEHQQIPTSKGTYTGTARDQLAKDIRDLRNHTNAPNSALQQLIKLTLEMYPESFKK